MKSVLMLVACLLPFGAPMGSNKTKLICHKWQQIGIKNFGKDYRTVDRSMAEVLVFKADGTYSEDLDADMHIKGRWKFNRDSSKLAFAITEMNGAAMADVALEDVKPADSIIMLSNDTLIYGRLAKYGREKVYGHEDSYFVRVD